LIILATLRDFPVLVPKKIPILAMAHLWLMQIKEGVPLFAVASHKL
jgi:hypothetical protein